MNQEQKNPEKRTPAREYQVSLTEGEMQSVANAMAAFFNYLRVSKKAPSAKQAENIMRVLEKMKFVLDTQEIVVPKGLIL